MMQQVSGGMDWHCVMEDYRVCGLGKDYRCVD